MKETRKHLKKKGKKNIILGVITTIVGLLLIYGVLNFNKIQGNMSNNIQHTVLKTAKNNNQRAKPSFDFANVKEVSPISLANAYAHRNDYRAIGQIAIPKWDIDLNIYQGVGNVELNLGAGTMTRNQVMGKENYPLAGHNMDDGRSYFSPLYTAKVNHYLTNGTVIMLTDYKNVYFYKITTSFFISKYRTDLIKNKPEFDSEPVISLFTCDFTGAGRLFVRGKLTGYQELNKASQFVQNSFLI